jgi:hypothetical protein
MSTIDSISRASSVSLTPIDTSDTSAQEPGEAVNLLPPPAAGGLGEDAMTSIAILLVQADNEDRSTARKAEDAADSAALSAANAHAESLRDKADQDEYQALCTGGFQIAGGVATGISGFASDGTKNGVTTGNNVRQAWSGAGQALPGAGTLVAGFFKANADRDDADGVKFDAQSQVAVRRYNAAHDDVQSANESIQKVEQFLQSVVQSQNEARNAAASMLRG